MAIGNIWQYDITTVFLLSCRVSTWLPFIQNIICYIHVISRTVITDLEAHSFTHSLASHSLFLTYT